MRGIIGALVAAALVAGAWWLLGRDAKRITATPNVVAPAVPAAPDGPGAGREHPTAVTDVASRGPAPTLAAIDSLPAIEFRKTASRPVSEKHEELRRWTWDRVETFVRNGHLTDLQRRRLLADLYDATKKQAQLLDDQVMQRLDEAQLLELRADLGSELEGAAGAYLDEGQLQLFRSLIPAGLVYQLTVGDVLMDPNQPDAKGWTVDSDDDAEEDIYQGRPPPPG